MAVCFYQNVHFLFRRISHVDVCFKKMCVLKWLCFHIWLCVHIWLCFLILLCVLSRVRSSALRLFANT